MEVLKYIVNFLKNEKVKDAIHKHLAQKKLILGVCNGFQALLKSGLLPYGEVRELAEDDLTLYRMIVTNIFQQQPLLV